MIVIVGAGLAGLAAGQKLMEAGQEDFIILEAQNYIGGRIKTKYLGDGFRIDLGAQWLHGGATNPIYRWLLSKNLINGPDWREVKIPGLFVTQQGKRAPLEIVDSVLNAASETRKLLRTFYPHGPLNGSDIQRIFFRGTSHICNQGLSNVEREIALATGYWFELQEAVNHSCENLGDLSFRAYPLGPFSNWGDFDGSFVVGLRGGWQSVVDHLVQSIGRRKVFLSSPVESISYTQKSANVLLANGLEIECDHVLVTISVGSFKHISIQNFTWRTIEEPFGSNMPSFGPAAKIFLEFDRPLLQEEKGIKLLWTDDANDKDDLPLWTRDMTGFDVVLGAPNVLLVWVGRSGALEAEKCSDVEAGQICLKVLETFLPNREIPNLISVTKSEWSSNKYIRCANSYKSIGDDMSHDTTNLWEPICVDDLAAPGKIPRILFAGEATVGMYATAHGAIISGWMEAANILKCCCKRRGRH